MALEDFLGRTSEIRIIDFLATNYDNSYNQSEISDFTGISRNILYKKLPEMADRKLLEVDNCVGRFKSYRLARNSIVNKLVAVDIEYNLMMSETTEKAASIDDSGLDGPDDIMENRYYRAPDVDDDSQGERMIPISIRVGDAKDQDGFIMLTETAVKKLYFSLKNSLKEVGRKNN